MPPRKRRKYKEREPSPTFSFSTALSAATKRLEKALAERQTLTAKLTVLNQEIPSLQQTISALNKQLGNTTQPIPTPGLQEVAPPMPAVPTVPPEIRARLPLDDLTGIGSIPATPIVEATPVPDDESFYLRPGEPEPEVEP